jgi:sec-independent protein translocase protein TatA
MGFWEIVLIFFVYLMLFGAKGVPSLARNMGRAVRTFRDASQDIQREIMSNTTDIRREIKKEIEDPLKDALPKDPMPKDQL